MRENLKNKIRTLGADDYIAQNDEAAMTAGVKTLDLIIDTIPASHDINPPLNLAKKKGIYVVVGVATEPFQVFFFRKIKYLESTHFATNLRSVH